ncbi:MAG: polysaccharide deacetylase family protein [Deltaproteobacteria bacterium]|nr:polysaccharide deacetylase family protein [Deltaproteobacteria bacterium]
MIREILPSRPVTWPNDKRVALLPTIHLEGDAICYKNPDGSQDSQDLTNRQYGAKVGIWRLLKILEKHRIRATFFVCGASAEKYPEAAKAIVQGEHDIAGHGFHHELLWSLSSEGEEEVFLRTLGALEKVTGCRPRGSRSCAASPRTLHTATKMGLAWDSSMWNDDYPYLLGLGEGKTLVEIPFSINNDVNFIGGGITPPSYLLGKFRSPKNALESWKAELDACLNDPSGKARMMTFCIHDYLSGHAANSKAFDEFLGYAKQDDRVWFATYSEMAAWWRNLCADSNRFSDEFCLQTDVFPD